MAQLGTHLELNDPVTIIWREGTAAEPLKDHLDSLPVINNIITLLEIPSSTHKVLIDGFTEVSQEKYRQKRHLEQNEILVNYANGSVQFHPSHEGKTFLCKYKGKGLILYPASRIYAMVERHPDVVTTLQDLIDEMLLRLQENNNAIDKLEKVMAEAEAATKQANMATDNAKQATDDAKLATEKALLAYKTTMLVFKPPVADLKELTNTYPYPHAGWTVQTYKDGKRYRFDGKDWILIDIFGQNIQVVNEHTNGLMSVAEHVKLKQIPMEVKDRVIVFCLPSFVSQGIQSITAKFPFDGELIAAEAICSSPGESVTEIAIEKSINWINWSPVFSNNLILKPFQHTDDRSAKISNKIVRAGDLFRIHILEAGNNLQNVTINLIVKI